MQLRLVRRRSDLVPKNFQSVIISICYRSTILPRRMIGTSLYSSKSGIHLVSMFSNETRSSTAKHNRNRSAWKLTVIQTNKLELWSRKLYVFIRKCPYHGELFLTCCVYEFDFELFVTDRLSVFKIVVPENPSRSKMKTSPWCTHRFGICSSNFCCFMLFKMLVFPT